MTSFEEKTVLYLLQQKLAGLHALRLHLVEIKSDLEESKKDLEKALVILEEEICDVVAEMNP